MLDVKRATYQIFCSNKLENNSHIQLLDKITDFRFPVKPGLACMHETIPAYHNTNAKKHIKYKANVTFFDLFY